LFTTIALFRKVALQVGEQLGYEYPNELDERMMNYLQKVKNLDAGAESFLPGGADG
jgi:aminoglycoside 6-adenylyltransferase